MRPPFLLLMVLAGCGSIASRNGGMQDGAVATTSDGGAHDLAQSTYKIDYVYAHSFDKLYKIDTSARTVSTVGSFSGCNDSVIDLALDENSKCYVTTFSGLATVDLNTAACSMIATGSYPNSLAFVPAGTLDANNEVLVGYNDADYVRIDTQSGTVSHVGTLSGGYSSSGDIISVKGGGTFLTVNGSGCADCLLQVDPRSGDVIQNYGSVHHADVWGLAFWGGTLYGFTGAGRLFTITSSNNQLVISELSTASGLMFGGAGSTTAAPILGGDGGSFPIQ